MPRTNNVYALPSGYRAVTGETIEAVQHNSPLEDLAADANNARPITAGGTGASNAADARTNLGAAAATHAVPTGAILMWSGSIASIPSGWALCDGTNGTPDLLDRFVVGAGDTYAVSDTGGAATVTLTTAQMPVHTHTGSAASAGAHVHGFPSGNALLGLQAGGVGGSTNLSYGGGGNTSLDAATAIAGAHSHTLTINNAGSGNAHENMPPYYALAYIMKL